MSDWLNHVTIAAPRNGTTSHTCDPTNATGGGTVVAGTAFTPTAGRFLLAFCYGSVTFTTPSGWTLPTAGSAINNGGLYVFYKASAAGSDKFTTTQNGSNYPVVFDVYEFASGSTFTKSAAGTGLNNTSAATPTLSSLTGTNWIACVVGENEAGNGAATNITWASATRNDFTSTGTVSGTPGYDFSVGEFNSFTGASKNDTYTVSGPGASAESLTVAVAAASGGTPVSLTGAVSDITFAAPAGTVATQTNIALTGAVANLALGAPAGSSAQTVALTGAVSNLTFAAPAGTVATQTNVTLTGAVSGITFAAPAGTVATGGSVSLTGAVANIALAAPAGTVATQTSLTGAVAPIVLAAPAGTVATQTNVTLTGAVAALTLGAPAGTVATGGNVNLSGPVSALTLAALAGTVSTTSLVALTGQVATVTFAAPAGTVDIGGLLHPTKTLTARADRRSLTASQQSRTLTARPQSRTLEES